MSVQGLQGRRVARAPPTSLWIARPALGANRGARQLSFLEETFLLLEPVIRSHPGILSANKPRRTTRDDTA